VTGARPGTRRQDSGKRTNSTPHTATTPRQFVRGNRAREGGIAPAKRRRIYHFDIVFAPVRTGPGLFGVFHWEAVFTLAFLLLAFVAATRQQRALWAYLHPASIVITHYMLVGALINELFVRIRALRIYALAQLTIPGNVAQAPIVGRLQRGAMLAFLVVLLWFMVRVAYDRRRASRARPVLQGVNEHCALPD
jgi:hypothetical protein